jgi:hypothetical protein
MNALLLSLIILLTVGSVAAINYEKCDSYCLDDHLVFYVDSLHDGDHGIVVNDNTVSSMHVNGKTFVLTYDYQTGLVTYIVDGQSISWTYEGSKRLRSMSMQTYASVYGGNSALLSDLTLNNVALPNVYSNEGTHGMNVYFDGSFTLQGKITYNTDANTNYDVPGFRIYAMSKEGRGHIVGTTNDKPVEIEETFSSQEAEVPEFSVLGALLVVVAGIGIILFRKT